MACEPGSIWTIGGVQAKVLIDGYAKGNSLMGGPWRDIIYQVDWEESDAFMDALLGGGVSSSGGVGSAITWPVPYQYPGNTRLVCLEVTGEPVGPIKPNTLKVISADKCNVRAHFAVPPYDIIGNNPDLTHFGTSSKWSRDTARGYIESYPMEAGAREFAGTGDPMPRRTELRLTQVELRRSRPFVPYLDLPTLSSLVGKVNAFPIGWAQTGTLKVEPWDQGIDATVDGSRVATFDTAVTWRPVDWNMELQPDGTWDYAPLTNGDFVYPYDDITSMFA